MKIIIKQRLLIPILISSLLILSGCTTNAPKEFTPKDGELSMADIYRQETQNTHASYQMPLSNLQTNNTDMFPTLNVVDYKGETRTEMKRLNNQFATLPNPQIALYIFPHRIYSGHEWIPVSGYTTAFHLYEKDEFALPSEQSGASHEDSE